MPDSSEEDAGRAELASKEESLINCAEKHSEPHPLTVNTTDCFPQSSHSVQFFEVTFLALFFEIHHSSESLKVIINPKCCDFLQRPCCCASRRVHCLAGIAKSSTRHFGTATGRNGCVLRELDLWHTTMGTFLKHFSSTNITKCIPDYAELLWCRELMPMLWEMPCQDG